MIEKLLDGSAYFSLILIQDTINSAGFTLLKIDVSVVSNIFMAMTLVEKVRKLNFSFSRIPYSLALVACEPNFQGSRASF